MLRRAAELKPDMAAARANLAVILQVSAWKSKPRQPACSAVACCQDLGQLEESIVEYEVGMA